MMKGKYSRTVRFVECGSWGNGEYAGISGMCQVGLLAEVGVVGWFGGPTGGEKSSRN